MNPLHPDFPEKPTNVVHDWDYPTPLDDIVSALTYARGAEPATFGDLACVTDYHIAYHGGQWLPGEGGGTELTLVLLGQLVGGRWFVLEAWNDYTGWGCQDGSDLYIGNTREDVIANGLTQEGRALLGVEVTL